MLHKLILGTVQLGMDYGINNKVGKPSLENAFEILHLAYDQGVRMLDTAEAYGESQKVIGQFQNNNPLKKFDIITKLSANHSLKSGELVSRIQENSLVLGTDCLYGYMFHNYQIFKKDIWLYNEILEAKRKKIIRYAGISLYSNDEIEDIIENFHEFDFIQIPFNLLDNHLKRYEIIQRAREKGMRIHTRSVFLQGLFFKPIDQIPQSVAALKPYLLEIEKTRNELSLKRETLTLQYALQKGYIDYVLIGVDNTQQLEKNIAVCNSGQPIDSAIIDNIDVKDESLLNPGNWN